MSRLLGSRGGFTYISALVMVMIMGILLGAVGQSMRTIMQREREKELIFRGMQYRDAIERWSKKGVPLKDLKDLYEPTMSGNLNKSNDRLIRKLYKDPITNEDFKPLPNPPDPIQGIYGVASTSNEKPLKQGKFPEVLKDFEGKEKYSDWQFVYKKSAATAATPAGTAATPLPLSWPEGP